MERIKKEVATMADEYGLVIKDIRQRIAAGQQVYDLDGDRVGFVHQFDLDAGWMTVESGHLVFKELYIPFSAITAIDPREIYLSLSTDTLRRDYASPPPRTTSVEEGKTAITTEPSGYDGVPVVVDRAAIDKLRSRIELGMRVYTADDAEVGTVKRYNPATGWMLAEAGVMPPPKPSTPVAGVFTRRTLRVPVTVVESVVGDKRAIYLSVHMTDLQRIQRAEPADASFDDEMPMGDMR